MAIVSVATFNVRNSRALDGCNSWIFRRPVTAAAIAAMDVDVLGLQEVFRRPLGYLLRHGRDYRAVGDARGGEGKGERCPLLVRDRRFEIVRHESRWFGASPDRPGTLLPGASFPRLTTMARLRDRESAAELDVWNVHLDERVRANRVRSTTQLAGWIAREMPTIVLGDFNAGSDDADVFSPLVAAGLRPSLDESSPGTAHDFTGRTDGARLDHILVSEHWQIGAAEVVTHRPRGRLPSDHWPVRAVLSLVEDGFPSAIGERASR